MANLVGRIYSYPTTMWTSKPKMTLAEKLTANTALYRETREDKIQLLATKAYDKAVLSMTTDSLNQPVPFTIISSTTLLDEAMFKSVFTAPKEAPLTVVEIDEIINQIGKRLSDTGLTVTGGHVNSARMLYISWPLPEGALHVQTTPITPASIPTPGTV